MTPAALPPRLVEILRGWERAEGIEVVQVWQYDKMWKVEWTERTKAGVDLHRAGQDHIKVSRLIEDIKDAAKEHGVDVRHLVPWRGGGLQIWWHDDAGRQHSKIYDPRGDRLIAMARATRAEAAMTLQDN